MQNWAGDNITILREAHRAVADARACVSTALDPQVLDDVREPYDTAVRSGIIHNRLRDWHDGNHPGYSPGCWPREYKEQVILFTRNRAVSWTNNVSERVTTLRLPPVSDTAIGMPFDDQVVLQAWPGTIDPARPRLGPH